jgi:mannose-6-phosphate isomerase-like protein (cupin superfamily)
MHAYQLNELQQERNQTAKLYLEFLRVPSLSAGLYELATGSEDLQQPHSEDELYYVANGQAIIRVDGEDQAVSPGSIIYVPANVEHKFHTITADLSLLVFFAPAETVNQ